MTDPDFLAWLGGATYFEMPGLPMLVLQHLLYALVPTLAATLLALPIGLWVGHTGRGGTLTVSLGNIGRAVPALGIIVIAYLGFGRSLLPVYLTLVAMAVPPILINTYVGIREVDPDVRDAARGMGLTGWQLLRQVELPMALPVVMAGIRTSAVQVVATATLAAYIGLAGLGRPIFTGLAIGVQFNAQARAIVLVGVLSVAVLAIMTELGLGAVQRRLVPRGLRAQQEAVRERAGRPEATTVKAA